jgi:hypothetical protein
VGTGLFVAAVVLFIAAVIVLIIALRRPRTPKQPASRQDPLAFNAMPQFGPRQLGPGAIVGYAGVDYVVRGTVTLSEGPFVWWEHLIEGDGAEPLWFSVETGLGLAGQVDFVDYATDDGAALLSFERYGADMPWELSTGTPVRAGELTTYPAPPPTGA